MSATAAALAKLGRRVVFSLRLPGHRQVAPIAEEP
jgi:hypothetical protein